MSSTNVTRSDLFAANKRAFEDIFGDPFAKQPFPGQYQILKGRGPVAAMRNNFDEGKATRVPAAPTLMDFFCDVENLVSRNLTEYQYSRFIETYVFETGIWLTAVERAEIEQKLGKLFRARKISPATRYFKVVRQAGAQKLKTLRRKSE